MNITEANLLNNLLDFLLGGEGRGPRYHVTTEDEAIKAASHLADRANKALMAGFDGETVRRRWNAKRGRKPVPVKKVPKRGADS